MIFAILFVVAFIIGLVAYLVTGKWLTAALISMGLFILNTVSDSSAYEHVGITLLLGLPVVFVASLFGAYVVELRRGIDVDEVMADESMEEEGFVEVEGSLGAEGSNTEGDKSSSTNE